MSTSNPGDADRKDDGAPSANAPETATQAMDRKEATLPDGGRSPDYDEEDVPGTLDTESAPPDDRADGGGAADADDPRPAATSPSADRERARSHEDAELGRAVDNLD